MIRAFTVIIAMLLVSGTLVAQTGQIQGRVTNTDSIVIKSATIKVQELGIGTITNNKGEFGFEKIKSGTYTIDVTALGFIKKQLQVSVADSSVVRITINLSENATQLSEVIVTAEKREDELQKVPMAITAVDAQKIAALQITTVNDIGRIAPNFKTVGDEGSFRTVFTSRGIGSNEESSPTVGFYVDDMPMFSTNTFPADLNQIQSIEVLRGPQGSLYGRNALAGVINIRTKAPTNVTSGFARIGYGNFNALEANAGLNLAIIKNKLFANFGVNYFDRDGYITNTFLNNKTGDKNTYGGNVNLRYIANSKLIIKLNSSFDKRDLGTFPYTAGRNLDSLKRVAPFQRAVDKNNRYQATTFNNVLNINYDFGKVNLMSITSHQYNFIDQFDEFDFSVADIISINGKRTTNTLTQEFRLQSNENNSKLKWLVGTFLYSIPLNGESFINYGTQIGLAVPPFGQLAPFQRFTKTETKREGYAFFGQVDYKITNKFVASLGLRYDYENLTVDIKRNYLKNGTDLQVPPVLVPDAFNGKANFNAFSPKFSLSYAVTESQLTYATVARGFRPGGINSFPTNPDFTEFRPEYTQNYEVGYKATWLKNRLRTNLSVFWIDWTDQQVLTVFSTIDNIGSTNSKGLEFETEFIPIKHLTVSANIGYQDATIEKYSSRNPTTGQEINFEGKKGIFTPTWNSNISASYRFLNTSKFHSAFSMDYAWQSKVFFDPQNEISQPAYGLVNARLSGGTKNIELSIWARNIFDETYFSYGFNRGGGNRIAIYGLPATYGLSVTAKF